MHKVPQGSPTSNLLFLANFQLVLIEEIKNSLPKDTNIVFVKTQGIKSSYSDSQLLYKNMMRKTSTKHRS